MQKRRFTKGQIILVLHEGAAAGPVELAVLAATGSGHP
jgi:hypothetical protein